MFDILSIRSKERTNSCSLTRYAISCCGLPNSLGNKVVGILSTSGVRCTHGRFGTYLLWGIYALFGPLEHIFHTSFHPNKPLPRAKFLTVNHISDNSFTTPHPDTTKLTIHPVHHESGGHLCARSSLIPQDRIPPHPHRISRPGSHQGARLPPQPLRALHASGPLPQRTPARYPWHRSRWHCLRVSRRRA
jgi:hypothetical protein